MGVMEAHGCHKRRGSNPLEMSSSPSVSRDSSDILPRRATVVRAEAGLLLHGAQGCGGRRDPAPGGAEDEADGGADDHEVEQHLNRDEDTRRIGPRRDVAEANRRKDRDREVERLDVVEGLREGLRGIMGHRQIDAGEQDEEDHDHDAQGLDGPEFGKLCDGDASYLPGEHGTDQRNIEAQSEEGPKARLVADRQDAERADDNYPREHDRQSATH